MKKTEKQVTFEIRVSFGVTMHPDGRFGPYRFDYWDDGKLVKGFGFLFGGVGVSFAREYEYFTKEREM